eukprot:15442788-Alexandrium_andersonii.AAC.1
MVVPKFQQPAAQFPASSSLAIAGEPVGEVEQCLLLDCKVDTHIRLLKAPMGGSVVYKVKKAAAPKAKGKARATCKGRPRHLKKHSSAEAPAEGAAAKRHLDAAEESAAEE